LTPIDARVPKRSFWAFDKNVAATTLLSFLLQVGLIGSTVFLWQETAIQADQGDIRKIMRVQVDTSIEEEEEELIEEEEEEEDVGKKAAGDEGKFGDPEVEPEKESKVPKQDGKMVDKIDVKNIGMNKLLNEATNTALSSILDDNANLFENKIAVAMSGTGSEFVMGHGSGGMGFRGSGSGGGGTGFGRIHGLGKIDTGGGSGVKAGLGKKKAKKVRKLKIGSGQTQGFCAKGDIRKNVRRRAGAIRACYERRLQVKPKLKGKITARWTITQAGKVGQASVVKSGLKDKEVEGCILRSIRRMRFKEPEGGICVVQWPFVFNNG
jgi:outer membrane biosynthesis protein TonB